MSKELFLTLTPFLVAALRFFLFINISPKNYVDTNTILTFITISSAFLGLFADSYTKGFLTTKKREYSYIILFSYFLLFSLFLILCFLHSNQIIYRILFFVITGAFLLLKRGLYIDHGETNLSFVAGISYAFHCLFATFNFAIYDNNLICIITLIFGYFNVFPYFNLNLIRKSIFKKSEKKFFSKGNIKNIKGKLNPRSFNFLFY